MSVYPSNVLDYWSVEAEQRFAESQRGWWPMFVVAFVWGVGTAFSTLGDEQTQRYVIQGGSLLFAFALTTVMSLRSLTAWLTSRVGLLVAAHVAVAIISGIMAGTPIGADIRYLLLIPTMALMLTTIHIGPRAVGGLRAGFTGAALVLVLYHVVKLDPGSLLDPRYRFSLFLNPNSLGFISAMCGISLLDYALRRVFVQKRWLSPGTSLLLGLSGVCMVLCIATKSRTSCFVFLSGAAVRLYLSLGFKKTFVITFLLALIGTTMMWNTLMNVGGDVSNIFQLSDRNRSISEGTGRFAAWGKVISEIWLPNFFLGTGPLNSLKLTEKVARINNTHNGLLQALAETGILGTAPLVILLLICGRTAYRRRYDPYYHFAIVLFLAGLLESFAETMFFSMGNPGSLLFMLSITILGARDEQAAPLEPLVL